MPIMNLKYRLDWIYTNIDSKKLNLIEDEFYRLFSSIKEELALSMLFCESIFTHLLYSIARNKRWSCSRIFFSLVVDDIASKFHLKREELSDIITILIEKFFPLTAKQLKDQKNIERDFLLYVLVQTMSISDEKILLNELGLGAEIFKKLKNAADSITESNSSNGNYYFLADIDQLYSELLFQISQEIDNNPNQLDCYRLKFSLASLPCPWDTFLDEIGGDWLLSLFVEIGTNKNVGDGDILSYLTSKFPIFSDADARKSINSLLDSLEKQNFLYKFVIGKNGAQAARWQLTDRAEELSASKFVRNFLDAGWNLILKNLRGYASWQVKLS
ncbi:MAG: hypothetical protein R3B45_07490 [Bdellovibrionota bacterium]